MEDSQQKAEVINHLEFLGFKVQPVPNSDNGFRAEQTGTAINVFIRGSLVNFSIWYGLNDAAMANRTELLEAANEFNLQYIAHCFITAEEHPDCHFSSWYYGPYEKRAFGEFVAEWQSEMLDLFNAKIRKFLA